MRENDNEVEVLIKDEQLGAVSVTMPKTGQPEVKVSIIGGPETGNATGNGIRPPVVVKTQPVNE